MWVAGKEFISVQKTARILGTSDDTVMRLIEDGRIEAYQLRGPGSRWRVLLNSVFSFRDKIREKFALNERSILANVPVRREGHRF